MYSVTVPKQIEAAHQLVDSEQLLTKGCARLHGHSYHIKVIAHFKELSENGMTADFTLIKDCIDKYDHRFLNDFFAPTTAEKFAEVLHGEITNALMKYGNAAEFMSVDVSETNKSWVNYSSMTFDHARV